MKCRVKFASDTKRNAIISLPKIKDTNEKVEATNYNYKFANDISVKQRLMLHRVNNFKKSNNIKNKNFLFNITNNPGNINKDNDMKLYMDKQHVEFKMSKYLKKTNKFDVIFDEKVRKCHSIEKKEIKTKNVSSKLLPKSNSSANLNDPHYE